MTPDALARLEHIKAVVEAAGRASVAELADALDVSEMTIRRDLETLREHGEIRRVRGGAVDVGRGSFQERFARAAAAKDRIAVKLDAILPDEGSIAFDSSTTLQRLAARLRPRSEFTVLTNGPECFAVLQDRPSVRPLLTGGELDRRTRSLVGPVAVRTARDLSVACVFMSAAGIDPSTGTAEATLEEAEVKLAMAEGAGRVVIAVDRSKLGVRGSASCLPMDRVDVLVTDLDPKDRRLDPYRSLAEIR